MQELFAELFWENEEISHAAVRLCEDIPGYQSARSEFKRILSQIQELVGFALCDQLVSRLSELDKYEVYAYYAVGLGLRKTTFQELCM